MIMLIYNSTNLENNNIMLKLCFVSNRKFAFLKVLAIGAKSSYNVTVFLSLILFNCGFASDPFSSNTKSYVVHVFNCIK